MTMIFGEARQNSPTIQTEGLNRSPRLTRDGRLFGADWREALILEGYAWRFSVGTITGGGNISMITGGGNGTTIDQDQPEFGISAPSTHALIPIEVQIACQVDMDADGEEANIILAADLAADYAEDGTVTTETPTNLLSGQGSETFPGTAFSAATADITDPTVSEILAFETIQGSDNGTAGNLAFPMLRMHFKPDYPYIMQSSAGVGLYGYWGGTAAVPGIATVVAALVPKARFEQTA